MSPKLKRRLKILAVIVAAGFLALNIIAYRQAWVMTHYSTGNPRTDKPEALSLSQKIKVVICGVNFPRPCNALRPDSVAPACRAITIPGTNGIKLGGWYCPAAPDKPLTIFFHGYGSEKSSMIPEARAFLDMGYSVLLLDFRGSGDSSESYTTVGFREAEDVASAVNYSRLNLPHRRLILYGGSMGVAAIVRAVAACGVQPDAIIAENIFDNMLNTVKHRFQAMGVPSFPSAQLLVFWGGVQGGFNAFANNPAEYAASVQCPILFLHGSDDPRAHLEDARKVFDAVPGPKRFREFPGLGHESSIVRFPKEWRVAVGQFLDEAPKQDR